jgi:predicted nucleotide-binding protein
VKTELEHLRQAFQDLAVGDEATLKRLRIQLETITRKALGKEAERFIEEINGIRFHPFYPARRGPDRTAETWEHAKALMVAVIESIEHALSINGEHTSASDSDNKDVTSNRVFVVHGHDQAMLKAVEAYLQRLGLKPVVLGEKANEGLTLVEKFLKHSDVTYAVVLLSPDDVGAERSEPIGNLKPRPRQNAILELGYFMARLGRSRVAAIVDATVADVEYPTDVSGVVHIPFNPSNDEWQLLLFREVNAASLPLDVSKA